MGGEAGRAPSGGLRSCACSRTGWGRHPHPHQCMVDAAGECMVDAAGECMVDAAGECMFDAAGECMFDAAGECMVE